MNNEHSDLKDFSGAENADPSQNPDDTEITELEGRGTRTQVKARERARNSTANLPGVAVQ
jgi:hypothetical protein